MSHYSTSLRSDVQVEAGEEEEDRSSDVSASTPSVSKTAFALDLDKHEGWVWEE